MGMIVIGLVVVVLILGCGIGAIALGGGAWFMSGDTTATQVDTQLPPEEKKDTGKAVPPPEVEEPPEPPPEEKPVKKPTKKPTTKPAKKPAKKPTTKPKPSTNPGEGTDAPPSAPPSSAPATPAPTGPQTVKFSVLGRGMIRCGDGTQKAIDGNLTVDFDMSGGGVSCLVDLEEHRCAGYIEKAGSCSCKPPSEDLSCR
jgi:hypothetical protein